MNTKPEQLNEKIAEWLGYKEATEIDSFLDYFYPPGITDPYQSISTGELPNFTTSQDTHGPIIEKLKEQDISIIEFCLHSDEVLCRLFDGAATLIELGTGPTMALAFCLAVEKIIDEGK